MPFVLSGWAAAQQQVTGALDKQAFADELGRLAGICDQFELAESAQVTRQWIAPLREDQTILCLPVSEELLIAGNTEQNALWESWWSHFQTARKRYAKYLFQQLPELASRDEQQAYRMLWQVLREDPEHEAAGKVLGLLAKAGDARLRVSRGRTPIAELGWSAGSYNRLESTHFVLYSQSNAVFARKLVQELEQFYALWSQVFYSLWARPGTLQAGLSSGKLAEWPTHERMEVVLLRDRAEYLKILGLSESNIGVSVGYYNPQARKSFFYATDDLQATLFHELTHQLLMEATTIESRADTGEAGSIWILEGIALYMESLTKHETYWSVGGWEKPRMQTARYRAVRDGYWPKWSSFCTESIATWKSDPNIAGKYTHAAGLTHVMWDGLDAAARGDFQRTLVDLYRGRNETRDLLRLLGTDETRAKTAYQNALIVDDEQMHLLAEGGWQPKELVLCGSQLNHASWQLLAQLSKLEWLDVSFSNVQDQDLSWLSQADTLRRLSLEGTLISKPTVDQVSRLGQLLELDLSYCPVDDHVLEALRGNRSIRTLWLTETQITSQSLSVLGTLPNLQSCDIRNTKISAGDWAEFVRLNPRISN